MLGSPQGDPTVVNNYRNLHKSVNVPMHYLQIYKLSLLFVSGCMRSIQPCKKIFKNKLPLMKSEIKNRISEIYSKLKEEVSLTNATRREVQLKLPGLKHYYAAQLIYAKIELKQKREARETLVSKTARAYQLKQEQGGSVMPTMAGARRAVVKIPEIVKMDSAIGDLEILVEYLTLVDKHLSGTTFDIKNLIELIKIETT